MESLTPFIRHELEDAPGPSGPPEETSSVVSPPLGVEPGQPPVTEPPKPGCGSQQPPSQPDGPDVQLPPPEVPQPRPDCSIQHPGQVVLHTTSQSASQTAPLVGEPLAKRQSFTECQSLPSLGEVALRSNDGEVSIPMTDGTPTACRQKNAAEFLAGRSPRGDGPVRWRAFRGRAASSQPRTCARRRPERRFTAGRVARRSALRLKEM